MITGNISELESKARSAFTQYGYSTSTIKRRLVIVRAIIRFLEQQGKSQFDDNVADDYIRLQESRYQNCEISRRKFLMLRKEIVHLRQINDNGAIVFERINRFPALPNCFEGILLKINTSDELNIKSKKYLHKNASRFFRWLHMCEILDLSDINEFAVQKYLIQCSENMTGNSLNIFRRDLKKILTFVFDDENLPEQINKLLLFSSRISHRMKPLMPQDEIAAILSVVDRNTVIGKRDYAIILLAAITGLRAIDIVELTIDSIDWRNGEIRIQQEKTDAPLALPLTYDVGKAVQDYILNARPNSKSDRIFLSTRAPICEIGGGTPRALFKKYCIEANLTKQWTFHSLRRSIATNMVISGIPVTTVAQTLGHKTIESTKPYISLDSQNLKRCALDFSGIQIGGDGG
jgi:site-specific recombinase XerD